MEKILIVEDDRDIAELERDYLEANGYQVEIAPDGPSGEKKALEPEVDLVLLDIMLPGLDGFQVCRQIREKRNIPILMVSARQEDVDKIRGLGLGADDYIVKPFSPGKVPSPAVPAAHRPESRQPGAPAGRPDHRPGRPPGLCGRERSDHAQQGIRPAAVPGGTSGDRVQQRDPVRADLGRRFPGGHGHGFRPREPDSGKNRNLHHQTGVHRNRMGRGLPVPEIEKRLLHSLHFLFSFCAFETFLKIMLTTVLVQCILTPSFSNQVNKANPMKGTSTLPPVSPRELTDGESQQKPAKENPPPGAC